MSSPDFLLCPLDHTVLSKHQNSLRCENGHSFDIAKTGYINLLPVQNKHSRDPGDSKEMVQSRKDFLNGGFYHPLVEAILLSRSESLTEKVRFLDAGCGEGYYTEQIASVYQNAQDQFVGVGLDISKWAVTAASKRKVDLTWLVASNAHIPVPNGQFNWLMCAFGFPVFSEFARVLESGGWLLMVDAGERHLIEMREILYPTIKPFTPLYENDVDGFELKHRHDCQFSMTLSNQAAIAQLLSMTPHQHKSPKAGRIALSECSELTVSADMTLRWYQKI